MKRHLHADMAQLKIELRGEMAHLRTELLCEMNALEARLTAKLGGRIIAVSGVIAALVADLAAIAALH